jgi:hypothetical protein
VRDLKRVSSLTEGSPRVQVECLQTIFPVKGVGTSMPPGATIERFDVPDYFGRPWAQIWEKYFESGMAKPKGEDIFSFR